MTSRSYLPLVLLSCSAWGQLTSERILNAAHEPQNWVTYSGDYTSQRYSRFDQITSVNVGKLALKWVNHPKSLDKMEVTPLVVDGILYSVQGNEVVALDAGTGRIFWNFHYEIPPESKRTSWW